jgi:hypothetical protein
MRKLGTIAGILASLVVIGLSAAVNARFGWTLGHTRIDSEILAAASVAFDVLKALGLFFIFSAWRASQPARCILASLLWIVVLAYSAASAVGFAALNRSDSSSERSQAAIHYDDLRRQIDRVTAELASIATMRSSDAVATDIGAMQLKREWNDTGGCQQASRPPSWCQTYLHLKGELAEAQHREALAAQRDKLIAESAQLPAISQGDPQTAVLSEIIPIPTGAIRTGLVVLVAIAMDLGSSLGLYVSTGAWTPDKTPDGPARRLDKALDRLERLGKALDAERRVSKQSKMPDQDAEVTRKPLRLVAKDGQLLKVQRAQPAFLQELKLIVGTSGEWSGQAIQLAQRLGWTRTRTLNRLKEARASGALDYAGAPGVGIRVKLNEVVAGLEETIGDCPGST